MKLKILLILLFICTVLQSQIEQNSNNAFLAKDWSKDISLFRSKAFLFQNVLGKSDNPAEFSVIPLAASSSGELTTLLYKSNEGKEGMILGFYGDFWNEAGVVYQGYQFKNLDKEQVVAFLNKIDSAMEDHKSFLKADNDNNNIYFQFDDMQVLIYRDGSFKLRIFWKTFDSTWENTAYERTKRRFERKTR